MIKSIGIKSPLGKIHHSVLSITCNCYQFGESALSDKPLYEKGSSVSVREELQYMTWNIEHKDRSTDYAFKFSKERIESAVKKHLPTKKVKGSKSRTNWMNRSALIQVRSKNTAYKQYLTTRERRDYDAYPKARNQAKWEISRGDARNFPTGS